MPPCNCHPPFPRPEPFSPLPRPGRVPDWGKWIRDRLAEKGALLVLPTRASFPSPGAWPNLYLDLETGAIYRWDREDYAVLVDPREGNDVLVYDSVAAFPDEGEQGKLYIAANTGSLYRWGGEGYVALLPGKADKAAPQAAGNFAALTQDGNLADSGKKPSDFATAAQGAKADSAVQSVAVGSSTVTPGEGGALALPVSSSATSDSEDALATPKAVKTVNDKVTVIEGKIPPQADASNQLADKEFVNSSVATNTATFRGTFNLVTDLELPLDATHEQVAQAIRVALVAAGVDPDDNDYAFVQIPQDLEHTDAMKQVDRYKCTVVGSSQTWAYEWSLNNSSFTAAQWAAINSGITSGAVAKLGALPTAAELAQALAGKRDYTDLSYDTTETVEVPALHATMKYGGQTLFDYNLFCMEDIPDPPAYNHLYTWRTDGGVSPGAEVYVTQMVSALTTTWTLYSQTSEVLDTVQTSNSGGLYPDFTFSTASGIDVDIHKTTAQKTVTVEDELALKSEVPSPSTATPAMDSGAGSVGSSAAYARGDHVHPTDTSRMAANATGADIAVSGTDATKIDAALAGKASTADATLTERFSAWTLSGDVEAGRQYEVRFDFDGEGTTLWGLYIDGNLFSTGSDDPLSTSEDFPYGLYPEEYTITATRTALQGYQLGSQSDKPLASEAEAEALRDALAGKVPTSRTINDKELSANVTLHADDIRGTDIDGDQASIEDQLTLIQQNYWTFKIIAPEFGYPKSYASNDICNVDHKLYRCKSAYTSAQTPKPPDDATHWEEATVQDALAALRTAVAGKQDALTAQQLANIAAVPNKADLNEIAYWFDDGGIVYDVGDIVSYRGSFWICIAGYTPQQGASKPDVDNTHWQYCMPCDEISALSRGKADRAANPTAGNLAALDASGNPTDSLIPAANVALKGEIPYTLGTPIVIDTASSETVEGETVNYGAATLANRTANVMQVTAATALDELRITFPAATSGKVRDFGLRVEIGTGSAALAAPALVPIAPTGETIKIENADGTIPALADGTATAKGVTLLYFSENAPGVFVVKGEQVEEVA